MARSHVLAIDQGTTVDPRHPVRRAGAAPRLRAQRELQQLFPADGWVEHDPEHIWADTLAVCREALERAGHRGRRASPPSASPTSARPPCVWERATGRAVHKAIVWQDRRTAPSCRELMADGLEDLVRERTGLVIDAYFSATKLAWLLDNVPGARPQAERGELAFGTVDSFLLWRLTGGRVHATDAANASRTMLFDIGRMDWDQELLRRLRIPRAVLPEVMRQQRRVRHRRRLRISARRMPVAGMAGDQQAATFGQACFAPGMLKSTYGTGCFALLNTGDRMVPSQQPAAHHHRLAARRQADLRARGQHLHRRCRHPVGARRPARHRQCRRIRGHRPHRPRQRRRLSRAGLHGPGRALVGPGRARRHPRADPRQRHRRTSSAPRSSRSATRPPT